MNTERLAALMAAPIVLVACGSPTDPNERNFSAALQQYFDKRGDLCLGLRKWPVDVASDHPPGRNTWGVDIAGQMTALESAGLVKAEEVDVETPAFRAAAKRKVRRYALTEAAKPFAREQKHWFAGLGASSRAATVDLCWGKKSLDKVVKWEGPMKFGDYQEALVTYTYKVDGVAGWAKRPDVQEAFSTVKQTIDGARSREAKHGLKLTSAGWEPKGLD